MSRWKNRGNSASQWIPLIPLRAAASSPVNLCPSQSWFSRDGSRRNNASRCFSSSAPGHNSSIDCSCWHAREIIQIRIWLEGHRAIRVGRQDVICIDRHQRVGGEQSGQTLAVLDGHFGGNLVSWACHNVAAGLPRSVFIAMKRSSISGRNRYIPDVSPRS